MQCIATLISVDILLFPFQHLCLLVVVGCLYVNVGSEESHLGRERRLKQAVAAETIGTLVAVKLCIHPGVERYVTEYWGSKERRA